MKQLIATKKLKRKCIYCDSIFLKGQIYYKKRQIFKDYENGKITVFEYLVCPKCKYKNEQHNIRFERFKPNCLHKIKQTIWSYIPRECVMQPDHDVCIICGEYL